MSQSSVPKLSDAERSMKPVVGNSNLSSFDENALQRLADENRYFKDQLAFFVSECARLKEERNQARSKHAEQANQVGSLRQLAMLVDNSHGSDAVNLIETINNASTSFALGLAHHFPFPENKGSFRGEGPLSSIQLALLRCQPTHPQARHILQLAMQSCILRALARTMEKAYFWAEESDDKFLLGLENSVRENVDQPTFSRWRAITYEALFIGHAQHQKVLEEDICKRLPEELHTLWSLLTGRELDGDRFKVLVDDTRTSMPDIIAHSVRFMRMIRVDIVSANFRHWCPTGLQFQADLMEMGDPLIPHSDGEMVVATTRLGLNRYQKVYNKRGDGELKDTWHLVLKPQVLTGSEVHAMISGASSTPQ
ncbi:hypothetical protein FRC02_005267 [Tulasnella sp. 418]|nr:hypothetical protein FRC02_005267 [Tulasnella sp. 418]